MASLTFSITLQHTSQAEVDACYSAIVDGIHSGRKSFAGVSVHFSPVVYQSADLAAYGKFRMVERGVDRIGMLYCPKCGAAPYADCKPNCAWVFAHDKSKEYFTNPCSPMGHKVAVEYGSLDAVTDSPVCGVGLPNGQVAVDTSMVMGNTKRNGEASDTESQHFSSVTSPYTILD